MKRLLLLAMVCLIPNAVSAQLGELQVGALASYGVKDPYRAGAGLVLGVATGRLLYVGLRWIYYGGATSGEPVEVSNRAQVFATDLNVQIPVRGGLIEMRPGIGIGMVQFTQRSSTSTGGASEYSKELFAAPGLALQFSTDRVALIPEVQYYFTGHSEMASPVHNKGVAFSVRLVFLSEIGRIRR